MSRAKRWWSQVPVQVALLLAPPAVLLWIVVGATSPVLTTITVIVWTIASTGGFWLLARHYSATAREHRQQLHDEMRAEMYATITAAMQAAGQEAHAVREAVAVIHHSYDTLDSEAPERS